MTFLHKLAQRLARMKTSIFMGVLLTSACEQQLATAGGTVTEEPAVASVASVSISPGSVSATTGQAVQLTAIPRDANGTPLLGRSVTWKSSNPAVVTVNANGLATGAPAGSATITATSEGKNGSAAITVTQTPAAVASVTVTPAPANVAVGLTLQLTATPKDASGNVLVGRSITWGSSNTGVAIVNGSGLVTALAVGAATITASSDGKSAAAAVTVTLPSTSAQWPNEPAGLRVLNDYGWSDPIIRNQQGYDTDIVGSGGWKTLGTPPGLAIRSSVGDAPLSSPYALQFQYPIGFGGGSAPGTLWYAMAPAREVYIGFWVKVSNPWQGHPSGVNKFVFVTSGGTEDTPCMPVMYGSAAPYYLRSQIIESGVTEPRSWLDQNVANPEFTLGVWHRIEIYIKYGTSSTSYDGIQKFWLDGALVMDYRDINYAHDGIDAWKFSPTWGGAGGVKTETDYVWIDHVRTSTR